MVPVMYRTLAKVACLVCAGNFFVNGVLLPMRVSRLYGQQAPSVADEMVLDDWVWQRVSPEGRQIARQYMEAYKKIVALYWNMEISGTVYRYRDVDLTAESLKRPADPDRMELRSVAEERYLARYLRNAAYLRLDSKVVQQSSSDSSPMRGRPAGMVEHILTTPEGFWRASRSPGSSPVLAERVGSFKQGEARLMGYRFAWAPISNGGTLLHWWIFSAKDGRIKELYRAVQVDQIGTKSTVDGELVTIKYSLYPQDKAGKIGDKLGEDVIVLDRSLGWVVKEVNRRSIQEGLEYRTRMQVDYEGVEHGIGLVKRVRIWEARIDPERLALYYDFQRDKVVCRAPPESEFTLAALGFEVTPRPAVRRWWQGLVLIAGIVLIGLFVWRRLKGAR